MKSNPIKVKASYYRIGFSSQHMLRDNASLQHAIGQKKNIILKNPSEGFVAGNIKVTVFMNEVFIFSIDGSRMSRLIGRTLVRLWAKDAAAKFNEASILKALEWIGVKVSGEVVARPVEQDYQNNAYMRQAIEKGKDLALQDASRGFLADNIDVLGFLKSTFYFRDAAGTLKKFNGETLLKKRGLFPAQKENIIKLLKDIGINVIEAAQAIINPAVIKPSPAEYADNFLMRNAIQRARNQFLRDPDKTYFIESENLNLPAFRSAVLSIGAGALVKIFTVGDLLAARGVDARDKTAVLSLLENMGFRVKTKPVRKLKSPPDKGGGMPRLSDMEYFDDGIVRTAVRTSDAYRKFVRPGPIKGKMQDILVANMTVEISGETKRFNFGYLLSKRGYPKNVSGARLLLQDLGLL